MTITTEKDGDISNVLATAAGAHRWLRMVNAVAQVNTHMR